MGSGLLNHLRIAELPPPGVAGLGADRAPPVRHGQGRFQASAGTGKCFSTALVVGIWSVSPQAVTEVELLAKSNWMLT